METCAYDEIYLSDAQNILGHAFDFALVTLGFSIDDFTDKLINSRSAAQFERGNPKYVTGMNGCEFVKEIYAEDGIEIDHQDEMYLDKSLEYWCGWAIAFYQWYSAKSFKNIFERVSIDKLLRMYPVFHEMDIMRFVEAMDEL
ncbi:MAG: hypothetical protein K5894_15690 [Lachnospiraceae bacterium]|nr:hypothetical protein [Lachnospiraceae bacterium]